MSDADRPNRPAQVDVLIPAYNAATTVEAAVGSIQRQTFADLRIVVVDDGSADGTGEVLRRMAAADPRIEVVSQANGGIVAALNAGLERCTAPLVARHDADDLAFPERIARQVEFLRAHPDVVAVGANAEQIDGDGRRLNFVTQFVADPVGDPAFLPAHEPYLLHPFLLVRREALAAVGGYRPVWHAEDVDLYWRLAHHGRLANIVEPLGEYRIHAGSVSSVSVVNGRIQAVASQLAALSELRRRRGEPDLEFRREDVELFKAAEGLEAMVDASVGRYGLSPQERDHLQLASSLKLMEMASYRPYRLEPEDVATLREAIRRGFAADLPGKQRTYLRRRRMRTAARLFRTRAWAELRDFLPATLLPALLVFMAKQRLTELARRRPAAAA